MTYYAVDYLSLGYYACLFSSPIEIFRKCSYYSLATGPPEKSARKEKKRLSKGAQSSEAGQVRLLSF